MNWKILNVSIPVKNLEVSKDFYNRLLNNKLWEQLPSKFICKNGNLVDIPKLRSGGIY